MARPRKLKPIMQMLRAARAPCILGMIVGYMMLSMQPDTFENSTVRHVEMFAGTQAVTRAWQEAGEQTLVLELKIKHVHGQPVELKSDAAAIFLLFLL